MPMIKALGTPSWSLAAQKLSTQDTVPQSLELSSLCQRMPWANLPGCHMLRIPRNAHWHATMHRGDTQVHVAEETCGHIHLGTIYDRAQERPTGHKDQPGRVKTHGPHMHGACHSAV